MLRLKLGWISVKKTQAAIEKVVKLLLIRAYRAFKHWLCVSLWQHSWDKSRYRCKLMCGEAVWSVVLARKESFNANSSVWLDDGEYHEIDDLNCLVPYSVQQADLLVGTVPEREHYVNLGVTVPSRLESEWLKMTPDIFDKMPEEDLMSMIDRELLWLDEILVESPLVSKPVSDEITVDWILYLADDFHWRGGEFLCTEWDHLAQVWGGSRGTSVGQPRWHPTKPRWHPVSVVLGSLWRRYSSIVRSRL